MEISTVLGFLVAIGAYVASLMIDGGSPASLVNISALVMVIGGSIGSTMLAYPMKNIVGVPTLIMQSFKVSPGPQLAIELFVELADKARREGLLSLEEEVGKIEDDFIKKGIMLIVDGVDPAVVRDILETDNDLASQRHGSGAATLEFLGGVSPAMGMVGTVTGLIGVLGNLSDTEALGGNIAIAFITTLYGVLLANFLWNPLGNKLRQKDKLEMVGREVVVEGILSIQAGENPRIVREKLESFLPPKLRGKGDQGGGE